MAETLPERRLTRADFRFELPPDLIAQQPPAVRGASRLLALDGASGAVQDLRFADLAALLRPGDLLVRNDTRVLPARIHGRKASGGAVEILVERILNERRLSAQLRSSKGARPGQRIELPAGRYETLLPPTAVADLMIDLVNSHAPNFKASVLGRQIMSPLDLERTFGLIGGDIFHGALSLDQLFSARPMLGHGDYRGPLQGLYMCGSGTHPGGGVTGAPGHNAAREIIADFRRGRLQA